MSEPTTSIFLSASTPAAPTGQQDVVFQSDGGAPQQKVSAYDPVMVGDSGSGGKAGNVPAPAAGDAAAGKFLHAGGAFDLLPMVVRFVIPDGSVGTDIALNDAADRVGSVSKCTVIVTASDAAVALTFAIKKNGSDVFSADPTIAAGAAAGSVSTFTTLTASPLAIAAGDIFTMDIASGSSSWKFIAKLE
ncbi:MAG: hypothetical protein WAM66_07595 [Acidobacteriaceae bacterium]